MRKLGSFDIEDFGYIMWCDIHCLRQTPKVTFSNPVKRKKLNCQENFSHLVFTIVFYVVDWCAVEQVDGSERQALVYQKEKNDQSSDA